MRALQVHWISLPKGRPEDKPVETIVSDIQRMMLANRNDLDVQTTQRRISALGDIFLQEVCDTTLKGVAKLRTAKGREGIMVETRCLLCCRPTKSSGERSPCIMYSQHQHPASHMAVVSQSDTPGEQVVGAALIISDGGAPPLLDMLFVAPPGSVRVWRRHWLQQHSTPSIAQAQRHCKAAICSAMRKARPGTKRVFAAVEDLAEVESIGDLTLKGLRNPALAFNVCADSTAVSADPKAQRRPMAVQETSSISCPLHTAHGKGRTLTHKRNRTLWLAAPWFFHTSVEKWGRISVRTEILHQWCLDPSRLI
jgi:hypothetical protein